MQDDAFIGLDAQEAGQLDPREFFLSVAECFVKMSAGNDLDVATTR